jgi:hypothetical protein
MLFRLVHVERSALASSELKGQTPNADLSPGDGKGGGERGLIRKCQLRLLNLSHHAVKP